MRINEKHVIARSAFRDEAISIFKSKRLLRPQYGLAMTFFFWCVCNFPLVSADDSYVEPGSFRLSHELTLENIMHRASPDWKVINNDLDKTHSKTGPSDPPWKAEWGQTLLTEAAARFSPDIFGRVLFEAQGDYADRFWRPNNIEHHIDNQDRHLFLRQAEGRIDRDNWYAHAFNGIGHGDWAAQGDFFRLYPASYPDDDYLRHSSAFGIYPNNFKQDLFLNFSKRHVPRGFEAGGTWMGLDAGAAYGNELSWGFDKGRYGRLSAPIGSSKLTFVYKDEDVPFALDQDADERNRAYALSFLASSEKGDNIETGVLYQPFRIGKPYQVARPVNAGSGLLGSSTDISTKKSKKSDALAERLRLEHHFLLGDHDIVGSADITHAGILAGNKNQVDLRVGSDLCPALHGNVQYTYRQPLEGPIPFLYEGTPDNIGAIAANPRGPDSPFTVNWENREAVFLTTTLVFDPTPGTNLLLYNPDTLQLWNVNPRENAPITVAFQHRMSDYRTTTDRQFFYDANGDIVSDPAAHSGAWASKHPLNEFRLLLVGRPSQWNWTLGFAGGQALATSILAYSNNASINKPITEYYSIEGRIERWPYVLWTHYGSGVWGPEPYQHNFGESFDRLWGLGLTYKITVNTTLDVSYLAARQDDTLYVAPDLGSYDEIRTLFSHRFGFLFQFADAVKPGYRAR